MRAWLSTSPVSAHVGRECSQTLQHQSGTAFCAGQAAVVFFTAVKICKFGIAETLRVPMDVACVRWGSEPTIGRPVFSAIGPNLLAMLGVGAVHALKC